MKTQEHFLDTIPQKGDLLEIEIESTRDNHLGERYQFVYEEARVKKVVRDKNGNPCLIFVNGILVKFIKISYRRQIFYTTLNKRRLKADISIISEE